MQILVAKEEKYTTLTWKASCEFVLSTAGTIKILNFKS